MLILADATLLRIFIGNDDTMKIDRSTKQSWARPATRTWPASLVPYCAGSPATEGRSAHVHEVLRGFSHDLPVVVEIIDSDKKINASLPIP